MTPSTTFSTDTAVLPRPSSKANKQRSCKLAAERKNYHLTLAQDSSHPGGYFCITETKLASGQAKVFPTKWQLLQKPRPTVHRQHQPAKSVLRRRLRLSTTPSSALSVSSTAAKNSSPLAHHSVTSSKNKDYDNKRVRFANRCDQRFYQKGSTSNQQFVKISYSTSATQEQEELELDLVNLIEIDSIPPETSSSGISDVIGAVKNGWNVQDIIVLLQNEVDRTYQDPTEHEIGDDVYDNWLPQLYSHVKQQKRDLYQISTDNYQQCQKDLSQFQKLFKLYQSSTDYERLQANLSLVQKLLNIYIHAETVVASARSLKQWGRYEINIKSISNLLLPNSDVNTGKMTGIVYFSAKGGPPQQLGVLPEKDWSSNCVVYSSNGTSSKNSQGAVRYLVHHNPGSVPDEKRELSVELYLDQLYIGTVTLPCIELSSTCTQYKKSCPLEKEILGSDALYPGAKVHFSVRKVGLKRGYLAEKRQVASNKLKEVIGWVQRFNQEMTEVTPKNDTSSLFSGHICAKDNVSLLHAAILFQEPELVQRLMKLNANPYMHSTMGTAMTLALNMSDRGNKCPAERKVMEDILNILQGHSFDKSDLITEHQHHDTENQRPSNKDSRASTTTLANKTEKQRLSLNKSNDHKHGRRETTTNDTTRGSSASSELSRAMRRLDIQSTNI